MSKQTRTHTQIHERIAVIEIVLEFVDKKERKNIQNRLER